MDDRFLYQLHEEPDSEFASNLRQMLRQFTQNSEQRSNTPFQRVFTARLAWITVAVAISILLLTTIAPVRAFIASTIANIAGQTFEMTDDYPGDNHPGNEIVIEPQILSLTDALGAFPHKVKLPTCLPSGYALNEEGVRVYIGEDAGFLADTIEITWLSENNGIELLVTNRDISGVEIVAPDSVTEISLDANHPAVVIQGGWDANQKIWSTAYGALRLRWLIGDLTYELRGTDLEQLIEIASSTLN